MKINITLLSAAFVVAVLANAAWTVTNEAGETLIPEPPFNLNLRDLEKAVDSYRDRASERKLELVLPGRTSDETRLRRLLILFERVNVIPGGELLLERYLADLRDDPNSALDAIVRALSEFPAVKLPRERALLLQMAASLPGSGEAVRKLALDDLVSHVVEPGALAGNDLVALSIGAHAAFLTAADADAAVALDGTVKAIIAQRDMKIGRILAAQFVSRFPAESEKLNSILLRNRVEIEPKLKFDCRATTSAGTRAFRLARRKIQEQILANEGEEKMKMRLRMFTLLLALQIHGMFLPSSTSAFGTWSDCVPVDVGTFSNRTHVRCAASVSGGIWFFAVSSANAAEAARFLSLASAALISGRTLAIFYDTSDTSGDSFGCQSGDCCKALGMTMR